MKGFIMNTMDSFDKMMFDLMSRRPKRIVCHCPKCNQIHKKKMLWTGNGKPRLYCDSCRMQFVNRSDMDEIAEHRVNIPTHNPEFFAEQRTSILPSEIFE